MNQSQHIQINGMANQLAQAAAVTLRLAEAGIEVKAALANGRQPLLIVDGLPIDLPRSVKRRQPNEWGTVTVIEAAQYHGCQLEWMHDIVGTRTRPAQAEAVTHG